jgi:hypothetical protein
MSADADRQAQYDQLRERFLSDPQFRAQVRSDPAGTLEGELGALTDEEREWISDAAPGAQTDDELVAQVSGKVGAW